jgi:hypothetical protein
MKKFTIEFTWAVIFTLASMLWTVLEKSLGFHDEKIGSQVIFVWLFGIPAFIVYFFAIKDKRNNFYNGKANWQQLFLSGVVMSVFVALMSPLAQYISTTVISPDWIKNSIKHYVEVKKMPAENAKMLFSRNGLILQAISNGISVGVIISAVVALFLKTAAAKPEPQPVQPKIKNRRK